MLHEQVATAGVSRKTMFEACKYGTFGICELPKHQKQSGMHNDSFFFIFCYRKPLGHVLALCTFLPLCRGEAQSAHEAPNTRKERCTLETSNTLLSGTAAWYFKRPKRRSSRVGPRAPPAKSCRAVGSAVARETVVLALFAAAATMTSWPSSSWTAARTCSPERRATTPRRASPTAARESSTATQTYPSRRPTTPRSRPSPSPSPDGRECSICVYATLL